MLSAHIRLAAALLASAAVVASAPAQALTGRVVNAQTHAPIEGATVTLGDRSALTNANGGFEVTGEGRTIQLRAPGFGRKEVTLNGQDADSQEGADPIALTPFQPRAVYLSLHGVASSKLREGALELVRSKQVNAFVIDVKSDRGEVAFKVSTPMAEQIGAQKLIMVRDMKGLLAGLKEQGIYTIARIVVFKDNLLATAHPEWAVRLAGGGFFIDKEHLRWVDPFRTEVWDYNIAIAKEAAAAGFDEVQYDYVRFPDSKRGVFAHPVDSDSRTDAITGFLTKAKQELVPWNVFTAANIFGYVCWNENDTDIGQKINRVTSAVDIISSQSAVLRDG